MVNPLGSSRNRARNYLLAGRGCRRARNRPTAVRRQPAENEGNAIGPDNITLLKAAGVHDHIRDDKFSFSRAERFFLDAAAVLLAETPSAGRSSSKTTMRLPASFCSFVRNRWRREISTFLKPRGVRHHPRVMQILQYQMASWQPRLG